MNFEIDSVADWAYTPRRLAPLKSMVTAPVEPSTTPPLKDAA